MMINRRSTLLASLMSATLGLAGLDLTACESDGADGASLADHHAAAREARLAVLDGVPPMRIGTYDNRAIAVAYAPSRFNPVGDNMEAYNAAREAGDEQRIAELEAWGESHQRQLHRQGFGHVPVDDLLAHVAHRLPEVAENADVDAIVFDCTWTGPNVEVVDVTMELVMLFEPTEKTLKTAREIVKHEPIDLDVIERNHEH